VSRGRGPFAGEGGRDPTDGLFILITMGEKSRRSSTVSLLATIDPKTLSIVSDAAKAIGRIDPKVPSIGQELSRSLQAGIGAQVAASVGESFRNFSAPVMSEALKGFQTAHLVDTKAFSEALKGIHAAPTFNFMNSLDAPVITPNIAEALRPSFGEAFRALDVPEAFSAGVNEALKDLARMPRFEVGPRFGISVREAAVIAESPAVRDQTDETLIDFDDLSPVQRRAFQTDVAHAIAAILTLVAYLSDDGRVELASVCLALAASFVSIYWRLTDKLGE
jgi:hypothetical protein